MCKECQKYYILAIKNINVDKCDLETRVLRVAESFRGKFSVRKRNFSFYLFLKFSLLVGDVIIHPEVIFWDIPKTDH